MNVSSRLASRRDRAIRQAAREFGTGRLRLAASHAEGRQTTNQQPQTPLPSPRTSLVNQPHPELCFRSREAKACSLRPPPLERTRDHVQATRSCANKNAWPSKKPNATTDAGGWRSSPPPIRPSAYKRPIAGRSLPAWFPKACGARVSAARSSREMRPMANWPAPCFCSTSIAWA